MQRDRRKLADVLNGAVPGQAVVEIGNYAKIDSLCAGLLQHVLDDAALARSGKENFVDELLAGVLKKSFEVADDVRSHRVDGGATGQLNKALERITQVTDFLHVLAERVCLNACADDEHVAGVEPAIEPAIKKNPIDEAAECQADGDEADGFKHNGARNNDCSDQVERAGEQEAGGKAGLGAHPLLMEEVGHVHGRIEMQSPAGDNEREGEAAQEGQKNPNRQAVEQRALEKVPRAHYGGGAEPVECSAHRGQKDGKPHPSPSTSWPCRANLSMYCLLRRRPTPTRDDDSFCQKSELAISSTQTSNFLKCLGYGPLGLTCNARKQGINGARFSASGLLPGV